jgi:hypothetical protein
MRKEDLVFAKAISKRLAIFEANVHPLPGIGDEDARRTFIYQVIESIRRIRFVQQVAQRPISELRANPATEYFDPVRAAILYKRAGAIDEACWLIFLFVHFGKNGKSGYRLIADVYGKLARGGRWTWEEVTKDPIAFRRWLGSVQQSLKSSGTIHRGFGNHRKYQSIDAWKPNGTGEAVQSYISWVMDSGSHNSLFENAAVFANGDSEGAFAYLYAEMSAVRSFGRTAKFDYLAMIGKLGLAAIRPDSVHFDGATGPLIGARLLFRGSLNWKGSSKDLELLSDSLASRLQVDKQVVEDSLCNWQKNPTHPLRFRG